MTVPTRLPRLVKWPFLVGDLVLVALGFFLAFSKAGELTVSEMALCIVAIAVGGLMLTVPFFLEWRATLKEVRLNEDLVTERADHILEETIKVLKSYNEQAQRTELNLEATENVAQRIDGYTGVFKETQEAAQRVISQLAELAQRDMEQPDVAGLVKAQLASLQEQVASVGSQPPEPLVRALAEQQEHLHALRVGLSALETRLDAFQEVAAQQPAPKEAEGAARSAKMLEKALGQADKEGGSESAVRRLIHGKTNPPQAPVDDEVREEATESLPESQPDPEGVEEPEPQEQEKSKPQASLKEAAQVEEPTEETDTAPPGLDLNLPPPSVKSSKRVPAGHAALIAESLIGIGNRLYLRGEGAGLSWDEGVPLEFVEIGKWRWTSPEPVEAPIEARLFLNDELAAPGDTLQLEPGQPVIVKPAFKADG